MLFRLVFLRARCGAEGARGGRGRRLRLRGPPAPPHAVDAASLRRRRRRRSRAAAAATTYIRPTSAPPANPPTGLSKKRKKSISKNKVFSSRGIFLGTLTVSHCLAMRHHQLNSPVSCQFQSSCFVSIPGPLSPAAAAPPLPAQPHRQSRQRLGLLGQCLHALKREQLHVGGTAAAAATTTPTTPAAAAAATPASSSGRRHEAAATATATDAEGRGKVILHDPIAKKGLYSLFCVTEDRGS